MGSASGRSSVDDIVARLERLPTSWWQVKARIIVGVATFFDAFDALAIASILPVIVPLWKLTPPQIGLMISAGFLGQLLGALLFGWIAERYGRMTCVPGGGVKLNSPPAVLVLISGFRKSKRLRLPWASSKSTRRTW